jgi:hypothetical protein
MKGLSREDSKAGRLQRAILKILHEHEKDDGLPTSARFLVYELSGLGIIPKRKKEGAGGRRTDQDVHDALTYLREREIIPWWWIEDETRTLTAWQYASSVAEYVSEAINRARIDLWDGEPPPMLICESRSLSGVLENLAARYLVPITSTNGQCGGHLHNEVAPNLVEGQRVLYCGDFDHQGGQIEDNTRSVLEQLVGPLDWTRLMLTAEQAVGLPTIRKPDRRYKPVRYHEATETEALGQGTVVSIIRSYLNSILPEPYEVVRERERQQRAEIST